MRRLAIVVLAALIAAPVGFLAWLNVNYWSGLSTTGTGWVIATSVLDVIAMVFGVGAALMLFGALVTWLVSTIWP